MRLVSERGAPQEERYHRGALGGPADWDAARVFLEVVRCGSLRSAAKRLELSINVVRRRIDDFERQTGAPLFTRDVHGTRPTDEGALVVSAVERMEAASFDLMRANAVRFRWFKFKDEFIHPNELRTVYKGESLNHLFGGFSTEGR
jgi:molybdenum-dependent DNA-binding transcriptional regulator ModE